MLLNVKVNQNYLLNDIALREIYSSLFKKIYEMIISESLEILLQILDQIVYF